MNALLDIGISNALFCGILVVVLLPLARWANKPALTHGLCILILLKLFTPPLISMPLTWNPASTSSELESRSVARAIAPPVANDQTATNFNVAESPVNYASPSPNPALQSSEVAALPINASVRPKSENVAPAKSSTSRTWLQSGIYLMREQWRTYALFAWVGSAMFLGLVSLSRVIRLAWALHHATDVGQDISQEVEASCRRLGIRSIPRVRFVAGPSPPMLLAFWGRPQIVIPTELWNRLNPTQQQTLLLHELAHLRRGDHWVRYLELLATCVYWWNPATWLARAALREAEEQCCDAWVVWAMPGSSRTYMTTILDAMDFLSPPQRPHFGGTPALASRMGQFHHLQRRLIMVREQNVQRRLGAGGLAAMVLLSAVAMPLGTRFARGEEKPLPDGGQSSAAPESRTTTPLPERQENKADPTQQRATEQYMRGSGAVSPAREDEAAKLEADLAAARLQVARLEKQIEMLHGGTREKAVILWSGRQPRLGHIRFTYEPKGADGKLFAIDVGTKVVMWTFNVSLNADSVVQCYDNETLLIKDAHGYRWLVDAEDGKLRSSWAPGSNGPQPVQNEGVNPFGYQPSSQNPRWTEKTERDPLAGPDRIRMGGQTTDRPMTDPSAGRQDEEKRIERMEQNIRALTEAVDRLTQEKKDRPGYSEPSGPGPNRK